MPAARLYKDGQEMRRLHLALAVLLTPALAALLTSILISFGCEGPDPSSIWVSTVRRGSFVRSARGPGALALEKAADEDGPGLSVDGTIEIETVEETLYVSRPAYLVSARAFSVVRLFKLAEDDTVTQVEVRLGRSSIQYVEVLEGLEEGDRVIVSDASAWEDVHPFPLR